MSQTNRIGTFITVPQDQSGTNPKIVSLDNPLPVKPGAEATQLVNILAELKTATVTTTTTAIVAGLDYLIDVDDGSIFSVNDFIAIGGEPNNDGHRYKILAISSNQLTLDSYVDLSWAVGTEVRKVMVALESAVGTLVSPVVYRVTPNEGSALDVSRMIVSMTHSSAGDNGKFGDLPPLTNGFLIRFRVGGVYNTFANWTSNASIKTDVYDLDYDTRSGGGGTYGTTARGSFNRIAPGVLLDYDSGDFLEFQVRDDLTSLLSMNVRVQGYVVL